MSDPTITLIARAIAGADGHTDPDALDPLGKPWWQSYAEDAEAALAALREQGWKSPTEIRAALDSDAAMTYILDLARGPSSGVDIAFERLLRVLVGDEQAEETP